MKAIKRGLYIAIFIISLFIINTNVKAVDIFTTTHSGVYTEKELYDEFSKVEGFNINEYKNIFCSSSGSYGYCYALTDNTANSLTYIDSVLRISETDNCGYYFVLLEKTYISNQLSTYRTCSHNDGRLVSPNNHTKSNFNFNFLSDTYNETYNVLDFSSYMSPEEEKEELEITIKGTELLNFMLDKTKNIYEVLIANQIFVLCLGVLLSYLIFIVIYKVIRK